MPKRCLVDHHAAPVVQTLRPILRDDRRPAPKKVPRPRRPRPVVGAFDDEGGAPK